ncbi:MULTISPECIES: cupredoxin domain-containing protein [Clostridium]|jgi:Uncharacterized protein conserved in bacteria|uniref:Cupredoxin domain-containing protein n=1 Tax=Clostridium beijerinckii TaxID=1520 RepID=A0AAE2RRA5_CLOBE|nr:MULTISPECIES: cupredoxin domain-containing protein [Clostridium]ALB45836.1 hypothetical protein X276_11465 [Clostridium beijerinckii NRRL B-598]AVK47051.1 hypothetical protein AXY43_02925 [Clostridium sp. MF28]MBF7810245.1 cupredoxin domain-containing protein [Clostridium beijerinckii]NOW90888.1 hypothetical protein [Clostridium beijerinckii]NRT23488.1 hypothetical protein [Clostridium beijerinckii]
MNIIRKVNKAIYKCLNNRKYVRLFAIGAIILLFSTIVSSFDMSEKLKHNLSVNKANASRLNIANASIENGVQVVRITVDNNGYTPDVIYVQKDIPVKLIFEGDQLNSCNNGIVLPSFNIDKDFKSGENIIEFIPKDEDIEFSCWMGMIKGIIKITDSIESINETEKF